MKIIIIGLGNFGSALGIQLTAAGHEVIGVDSSSVKAEAYKDLITQTIVLDSTNEHALKTLPLRECDYAVVAIGEDFGASVMTTALLKQANVKHLVSRAINELHSTVLETLGVEMIIRPEKDSASLFADRILLYGVSNAYHISDEYKIVEAFIPGRAGMMVSPWVKSILKRSISFSRLPPSGNMRVNRFSASPGS